MQPVWDEYVAASRTGHGAVQRRRLPAARPSASHAANALLDNIERIPVVLVVAADLRRIVGHGRRRSTGRGRPGASIYPFCWNVLLAARERGLGGVMTTFLSRVEPEAGAAAEAARAPRAGGDDLPRLPGASADPAAAQTPVEAFASVDAFEGGPLG